MDRILVAAVLANKLADSKGEVPIWIRITINRRRYFKASGFKIAPDLFSESDLISKKVDNSAYKNGRIRDMARSIERELYQVNGSITPEVVKSILSGEKDDAKPKVKEITLYQLCVAVKREFEHLDDLTLGTYQTAVDKYIAFAKGDMPVSEVTPIQLNRYLSHATKVLKQNPNTTWSDFKRLRSVFNKGKDIKLITHYPFDDFSLPKYNHPKKNYLTNEQVTIIEEYADNERKPSPLRKAAAWLALACYSGMRYGDMVAFNKDEWVKDDRLYFADEKESTPHFIPLYPKLVKAIDRALATGKIMQNQPFNRFLKEVAEVCEIPIKVTGHMGRHTFAVNYLSNGGSKEVLQKLMGHKRMATTEIYGQITDSRVEKESLEIFNK